ncbi:MAG TPA: tetratricopeptide repeat protein [Planctomycetota bacterium]
MRKKTKLILAAAIVAAASAVGAGAAFVYRAKNRKPLSAERASEIGREHLGRREWVDAYKYLAYAAERDPADATLHWEAAQPALQLRQKPVAYAHARSAWDAGMKTPDVLLALLTHGPFKSPEERLASGRRWLESIPEGPARQDLEGDIFFLCGKKKEAVELWLGLPRTPVLAGKIAAGWVALGQAAKAVDLLRGQTLDDGGTALLGSLLAALEETSEAAAVFDQGRARHPESKGLRFEWCVFLVVQDRHAEAVEALDTLATRALDPVEDRLAHAARLLLGLLAGGRADAGALDALAARADGDEPWLEGERALYKAIRDGLGGRAVSVDALTRVRTLLKGAPAAEWAAGRELARVGEPERAAAAYRAVSGPLARSPALQLELARVLAKASRLDEALAVLGRLHARKRWSRGSMELYRDLAAAKGLRREAVEAQTFLEGKFKDDADLLFSGGVLALRSGELGDAAKAFDAILARQPDRQDAEIARLSILLARREYADLLRECDASRAPPHAIEPLRAEALLRLGRADDAEAAFERAAVGRVPSVLLAYASLLLRRGKPEKAGSLYAEVLQKDSRNEIALLGTAAIALQRRDWTATREAVEKVVAFGTPSVLAYSMLAEAELGGGRPERALAASTRGLALAPDDPGARFRQGVALLDLGKHGEAETILRRCAEEGKGAPHVLWQLARVKIARGDEAEALRIVEEAATSETLAPLRLVLLARSGRGADARALLESIRAKLSRAQALACDAWIHECEGRLPEAADTLRAGIADPAVAVRWADVMFRAGREDGVVAALDAHPIDGRRWLGLAERARERKLCAAASACYRRALKNDPENPLLLNNFAWMSLQARTADLADILAAARKAVALAPDHPSILHTYGTALMRAGRTTDCVALLEKDPGLAGRVPSLLLLLGEAYEKLGRTDAAVRRYAACLAHPATEGVEEGELSRASLRRRIEALSP